MRNQTQNMTENSNYPKEIIDKLFFDIDRSDFIIIKAHLFIEYGLNQFLEVQNKSGADFEKMNFTFMHKFNICKLLGLFMKHPDLETYILDLNKLRNQVAHKHSYDEALYDKVVDYPSGFEKQKKWATKEAYREGVMAIKSAFMYGIISSINDRLKKENFCRKKRNFSIIDYAQHIANSGG